ncbi:MORN_motif [Hexamita inflata]|uniref:MORN motif n=1 Tax=Hexamita inflata TaxID=28002 RepID=A0AA86V4W6_9EUKA|nr:MORN motif [Hexamita inflata]
MKNYQTIITESYQYVGQVVNDQISGNGVMIFNDGSYNIGQFSNEKFTGTSASFYASAKGCTSSGMLSVQTNKQQNYIQYGQSQTNNKQIHIYDSHNQQLVQNYNNGVYVDGVYVHQNIQIQLFVIITSSYIYVGQLKKDTAEMTSGTLVFNDGSVYSGQFKNNRFSGEGTFISNGITIIGKFFKGNINTGTVSGQKVSLRVEAKLTSKNWQLILNCFSQTQENLVLQDYYNNIQVKNKSITFTSQQKQKYVIIYENQTIKSKQIQYLKQQSNNQSQINNDKDCMQLKLENQNVIDQLQNSQQQQKLYTELQKLKQHNQPKIQQNENLGNVRTLMLTKLQEKTDEIQKLKDQEKEFCTLMQQNNEKQNAQNVKLKTLITNLLNEQKETETKVNEMVKVFNDEKKTLIEKHELEMKNPEQYKINQDKTELESHKAGITEQLTKDFNLQLVTQKQQFDSQIQYIQQQNQNTMLQYQQQLQAQQQQLQACQQQLQACQVEKQNIQQNAQQYSVTIQNEAKQWIATETARITTELNNQQQQLKDEKQSLEVQITKLKLIVDKIPQIVTVNNIIIDLKEFPEAIGLKLIRKLEKQLPKMISAEVAEDRNIIVMVKQEDAEETAKIIQKLKVEGKRLQCQVIKLNLNQSTSDTNIAIDEDTE